jgi:hypothetical protein
MGNRVTLQVCKFVDYHMNGNPSCEHWGYRIYDDYGTDYDNFYETLGDVFDDIKEETILAFIGENHNNFYESVLFCGGLYLCDSWVDVTEQMSDDERERIRKLWGMDTL